jgi:iron transport multicopper oxidase
MVVKAKKNPAPYQARVDGGELLVTLGDWYHEQAPYLLKRFVHGGAEPLPDSGLINSGRDAQFPVKPGKTYLLRVINTGNTLGQYFEVDGHDLTIVEADGIYVEPYKVDRLYLAVSQRYSVLLTTKTAPVGNYLIKCQMDLGKNQKAGMYVRVC